MSPSPSRRLAARLAIGLLAGAALSAQAADPSAWCDALFPVDDIAAASLPGTPDPTATGNVTRAGYSGGDQCAPLNRNN